MCATMEGYKYKSNNNLVQEIYPKLTKRSYKKYPLIAFQLKKLRGKNKYH